MNFLANDIEELTNRIWQQIHPRLKGGFICALEGPLGSGKTTLVQGIARKLGIKNHITSPTFTLRKSYPIPRPIRGARELQHIDLYRLEDATGYDKMELEDWLRDYEAITFIEWAENIQEAEKSAELVVKIKAVGDKQRKIELI